MKHRIVPGVIDGKQALCCLPLDRATREAARIEPERRVGAVMVVEDGRLQGIVTERDLVFRLLAEERDARSTRLDEIMTADPETLTSGDTALAALDRMRVGPYRHLPVADDGDTTGMVLFRDRDEAVRLRLGEELRSAEALIYGGQYGVAAT